MGLFGKGKTVSEREIKQAIDAAMGFLILPDFIRDVLEKERGEFLPGIDSYDSPFYENRLSRTMGLMDIDKLLIGMMKNCCDKAYEKSPYTAVFNPRFDPLSPEEFVFFDLWYGRHYAFNLQMIQDEREKYYYSLITELTKCISLVLIFTGIRMRFCGDKNLEESERIYLMNEMEKIEKHLSEAAKKLRNIL